MLLALYVPACLHSLVTSLAALQKRSMLACDSALL